MRTLDKIQRRRCERRGHDWFPNIGQREFLVTHDVCLRCSEERMILPWGECLSGHPIAEHYDEEGLPRPVGECWGPY